MEKEILNELIPLWDTYISKLEKFCIEIFLNEELSPTDWYYRSSLEDLKVAKQIKSALHFNTGSIKDFIITSMQIMSDGYVGEMGPNDVRAALKARLESLGWTE